MHIKRDTVVIAEDNLHVRKYITRCLEYDGLHPVVAKNAEEALRKVQELAPRLVITDVHLGEGPSGFELCRAIRNLRGSKETRILLISGALEAEECEREAREFGDAQTLSKPFTLDELRCKLRPILADTRSPRRGERTRRLGGRGLILVADADKEWLTIATGWLESAGHRVIRTDQPSRIVSLAIEHNADCLVIAGDLGISAVSKQAAEEPALAGLPLVAFSSREQDKHQDLYAGADHFVLKGDQPDDLLAAVHVSLRSSIRRSGSLVKGDLMLVPLDLTVRLDGKRVTALSKEQFRFLHLLAERAPEPVGREELFRQVLGLAEPLDESNALDALVSRLKTKLGHPLRERIKSCRLYGWFYLPEPHDEKGRETR